MVMWKIVTRNSSPVTSYQLPVTASVVGIGIRRRRAVMEKIEVAALVGLGNVIREHLAVAARVVRRARLPGGLALRELRLAHLELELPRLDVELDHVAV